MLDTHLGIFDIDHSTFPARVRREVGRWPITEVGAEPLDVAWAVRLRIRGRRVDLEATTSPAEARELVQLLLTR